MASGKIYGVCYDANGVVTDKYLFYAEYSTGTSNADENYTPVTVSLKIRRNPDHAYAASAYNRKHVVKVSLSIDGEEVFSATSADVDTRNAQIWTFTTQAKNVFHNDDGKKTLNIKASFSNVDVSSLDKGSLSDGVALATIPRASEIISAADVTLGNKCNIKWKPAAASFRYTLKFTLGDWSYTTGAIHPNQTSAYTYTGYPIPLTVAKYLTSAKTGTMKVTLTTYSDNNATDRVGSADSETFTVTVPDNSSTQPSVSMTLAPVSSLGDAFAGLYIQGKTKVRATLSATGKYDAKIKAYRMKVGAATYDSDDDYTSDYLSDPETVTVYGYAEDYREITGSTSKEITVIPYSKPKIQAASGESEVVAVRCDSGGNPTDSGTYLKIKAKRSYSPVKSGSVQKNFCKIQYRYKLESASNYSAWTTILAGDSLSSDEIKTGALLGGALAAGSTYLVQVRAIDDVGEYGHTTITVPTDKVYMHRDKVKRALSIGKYIEDEYCVDIAEDITLKTRGPIQAEGGGNIDILVLGTKLTATADAPISLNDCKTPGNFYSPNAENSQHITNCPNTEGGFGMTVRQMQTTGYIRQELFYGRTTWIRHWNGTEWSEWWRYLTTTVPETASTDYVVETGNSGGWTYKKWKGGTYELFGTFEVKPSESTLNGSLYRTNNMTIDVPFTISSAYVSGSAVGYYWITNGGKSGTDAITLRLMSDKTFSTTTEIEVRLMVVGTYA